jgi:hypothetical protein
MFLFYKRIREAKTSRCLCYSVFIQLIKKVMYTYIKRYVLHFYAIRKCWPIPKLTLTRLALGRQSSMEKTSLAFPSGSLGRKTPTASTSIWYRQDENTGSGSSRRYSFSRPEDRCQKAHETGFLRNENEDPTCIPAVCGELIIVKC